MTTHHAVRNLAAKGDFRAMAPPARKSTEWYQEQLLKKIDEVAGKVEESLTLSRQNGHQIQLLRSELGLDVGSHGRLPQLEAQLVRYERRLDTVETCLKELQANEHEETGRANLKSTLWSLASGSAGATLIGLVAKFLGLIH